MSYCFNPNCPQPNNERQQDICHSCGASLLLNQRYRGIRLLGKSQLALTVEVIDTHNIEPGKDERQTTTDNSKVLKILLTDYSKALTLFQQEAAILSAVNCPGIPRIAEDGYFSCQPQWHRHPIHCLVIEKIAGIDLEQWLNHNPPLSLEQAQDWLGQLLDILERLHQQQYFHRDLKPSNIILQPNGKLALIDFGAARKVTTTYLGKVGVNQGVTSIGTPGYIAPEQIDGAALPQSDFFGLGRTLVHLVTGKHPQEFAKNLDTGKLVWREHATQISIAFADLLDLMMSHLPSKRPVNVAAIRTGLAQAEQYPQQAITKSRSQWRLYSLISGSILFLPLAIFGLLSLGENLRQQIATVQNDHTPLCNNLTCINRDPIDNKCDRDGQTITSNTGNYQVSDNQLKAYRLELRLSSVCQATWARTEAPVGSSHYVEDSQGNKYGLAVVAVDQWQRHYTDMAPGTQIQIRACAEPPSGPKTCTNFVAL